VKVGRRLTKHWTSEFLAGNVRGGLNMLRIVVVPEVIAGVVSKSVSQVAISRCSAQPFLAYPIGRWFTH
jgi:hypothetical protein